MLRVPHYSVDITRPGVLDPGRGAVRGLAAGCTGATARQTHCIGVHQSFQAVHSSRLRLDLSESINFPQVNIVHVTEAGSSQYHEILHVTKLEAGSGGSAARVGARHLFTLRPPCLLLQLVSCSCHHVIMSSS